MKKDTEKKRAPAASIFGGFVIAVAITAIVFIGCAAAMTLGVNITDKGADIAVYITSLLSVLAGSISAAARTGRRGMINGMTVGIIYTGLMLFVGYIVVPDISIGLKTLITLAVSVLSGAVGGIIGVNLCR